LDAPSFDDIASRLGTAEDARFFGLFSEGVEGGEGIIGKVQCEGPHAGDLHNTGLQKYNYSTSHHVLTLLSVQSLSDSNFPEAAEVATALQQSRELIEILRQETTGG
jgi:hypothetical protein